MLSDANYRKKQLKKLHEYRTNHIIAGKNLLITADHYDPERKTSYIDLPHILWQLVRMNILRAKDVVKIFYPNASSGHF